MSYIVMLALILKDQDTQLCWQSNSKTRTYIVMLALTKWQSDYTVCVVPCEIKNHQLNKCQIF